MAIHADTLMKTARERIKKLFPGFPPHAVLETPERLRTMMRSRVGQPFLTSSTGGDWFDYYDTSPYKTESTGGTVALQSTYGMPAANSGCSPVNGCLAYCTYPNSDPWFFSSTCKDNSGFTPTANDCTGTHQIPGPSTFSRTHATQSGVKGIQFDGTFNGSASSTSSSDNLVETVFAHQQQCYAGHQEYGFVRTLPGGLAGLPEFYFYWSDYTNCDGAVCYDDDNHPPLTSAQNSRVGLIGVHLNTSNTNRYERGDTCSVRLVYVYLE